MTTLLVLRLRYKLVTSGRLNRLLLAEEATGLAFSGLGQDVALNAEGALSLLEAEASSNMDESARIRRSEEHTSELQSLMRISYAVFCLKKKNSRKKEKHY